MIYGGNTADYDELAEALKDLGVDKQSLEIMKKYLDTDSECNDKLLDKVKLRSYYGLNVAYKANYSKAVKKTITEAKDEELERRFICFLYALFGASCSNLLVGTLSKGDAKSIYITMQKWLTPWLGEEKADKCAFAVSCEYDTVNTILNEGKYVLSHPAEKLAEAAKIMMEANTFSGRITAARALDKLDSSSAEPSWVKDLCKTVLDSMTEPMPLKATDSSWLAAFTVLAEGSVYSDKMKKKLMEYSKIAGSRNYGTYFAMRKGCLKISDIIEAIPELVNFEYVLAVSSYKDLSDECKKMSEQHLEKLAREHTDIFTDSIQKAEKIRVMKELNNVLEKLGLPSCDIKVYAREKALQIISNITRNNAQRLMDYVEGKLSLEDITDDLLDCSTVNHRSMVLDYYHALGADDFFARFFTVIMMMDMGYSKPYAITSLAFSIDDHMDRAVDIMMSTGLPTDLLLRGIADCIDNSYSYKDKMINSAASALAKYPDKLKGTDVRRNAPTARLIAVKAMADDAEKYIDELLAMTEDGSKAVKGELVSILASTKGHESEIARLLSAKKAAKRETAISVIEKQGAQNYTDALKEAFEKEKSAKLKDKIAMLIGAAPTAGSTENKSFDAAIDPVEELTKGSKMKKVEWVFGSSCTPVHFTDGSEAEQKYLAAMMLCYAGMSEFSVSSTAKALGERLDAQELRGFAQLVFVRWLELGAQAKQKWVLYFTAIHGGDAVIDDYMHYIKDWSECSRSAIAAEAVRAMALSGSTTALMNVDGMSRKFKNKQVRRAAGEALANAAEKLGLTTEELADRIVPDPGFDENMCRVFDFGSRQFKVYLSGGEKLEIFCGDKQMKNLPKPGANDDAEKAAQAAADFKELKKQIKNVAASQKARLEYVLMCDRKWTAEGWKALFVKNAVMHGFATGLIWGLYDEDSTLKQTFRYMEDGSFNTSDEDELEIPENVSIGLVHPLELSEEDISAWKEQLEDYEIVQPFPQLERRVYRMTEEEKQSNEILRFNGKTINSLSLIGKMTKLGWYKGQAEDAGWFYYFFRKDLSRRTKNTDGTYSSEGMMTELEFSGASIVNYDFEGEEVTIEKLKFHHPDDNLYRSNGMKVSEVSPRYFSEIIMQLTNFLGE